MNIFRLDDDTELCARYQCDRHLVKMPVEQLAFLKRMNHPLSDWAYDSRVNYAWLLELCNAMCREFHFRYGQLHFLAKTFVVMDIPRIVPDVPGTVQPYIDEKLPVPIVESTVENYRNLYRYVKADLCTWTFRLPPSWFTSEPRMYFNGGDHIFDKLIRNQHE